MQSDSRGLELTTTSEDAAKHIDQAVDAYMDYRTTASAQVKKALDADPDFALAKCFRGYFLLMLENKAVLPKVQQVLDEIRPRLDALTQRERLHASALEAWAAGDIIKACLHWERLLTESPRDLLALKLHHTMSFYAGRSQVMRSVLAGVLGEWDDDVPGYGCVQGMYAYALEECGDYVDAERWGRQAVERNPGDLWAIHSVAHVLEMQGRSAEGVKWLDYTPDQWAEKNPFKAHVWWHAALFFMAQGESERALQIYDNELNSVNSETYVDVSNQAALLKRLQMGGVDIGNRWEALAEHSEKRIDDHMLPFRDAHFGLALAANGNFDVARRHVESMAEFAGQGQELARASHQKYPDPFVRGHDRLRGGELRPRVRNLVEYSQRDRFGRRQPCAARLVRADHLRCRGARAQPAGGPQPAVGAGAEPRHPQRQLVDLCRCADGAG